MRQIAESVAAAVKIAAAVKVITAAVTFKVTVTFRVNTAEIAEAKITADINRAESSAATAAETVRSVRELAEIIN